MCRVGCPQPWRARSMLRLSAVLSGRSLSFLKTSVIYLFSVSLMSCHGLERKPNVADVRMAFSY